MQPLRLFWAVNLPVGIKAKLAILQGQLKKVGADVKWVEEENFHLTVNFLGDVETGKVPAIIDQVKKEVAGGGAVKLQIQKLGVFPQRGRPRVLWAGVYGEKDKFVALHNRVQKALVPLGFTPEEKSFSPHLTLGRVRSYREVEALLEVIADLNNRNIVVGEVMLETIDLMQSELTRLGPVYRVLETVRL